VKSLKNKETLILAKFTAEKGGEYMDIMTAFKKPFSNPKTLVIGAIIGMIPIVDILLCGFILKVAEDSVKGNQALRSWAGGDVVDYIVKAIMAIIVGIVYMIIPLIIIGVGLGAAIMGIISAAMGDPANMTSAIMGSLMVGGPFLLVGGILAFIAEILLPMAILRWLKSGSLGAAFGVGGVVKNVLTADYIIGLIVCAVYAVILMIVAGILGLIFAFIPVVGWILSLFVMAAVMFSVGVAGASILAQTVK
jgi:hypothetical protein